KVASLEQAGDLAGIDLIVLGLGPVDEFHVQSVAQHEGELLLGAEVGEPVPGVHALDADHDIGPEGGDGFEESLGPSGDVLVQDDGAGRVEGAQVQGPGVQVDAAVQSVL